MYRWLERLEHQANGFIWEVLGYAESKADEIPGLRGKISRCKILGKGCFVAGTPVLMAGTLGAAVPIQEVRVDDMVKAYQHEETYLTASSDADDIYVPGWQGYDYLDITPETWQVGRFIIEEEDENVVEIEANRPKEWFAARNLAQVGDRTYLYLPELGVAGEAVLRAIRPTRMDTRRVKPVEGALIDRPVISTFKRYSTDLLDHRFSDGSVVGATPEHPFFSVDRGAYVPVGSLRPGERVLTAEQTTVRFLGSTPRDTGEAVYNFEVWRAHNYFVAGEQDGQEWFLVHNACPPVRKVLVSPEAFQEWLAELRSQINPKRNSRNGRFERYATGDDIQYEIKGGGEKIWADGIDDLRNAVIDAKDNLGDFYTLEKYLEAPFLFSELENEFRRYASVISDNFSPVAELIIRLSNDKESSIMLFQHLGDKFDVPTSVEVFPWSQ